MSAMAHSSAADSAAASASRTSLSQPLTPHNDDVIETPVGTISLKDLPGSTAHTPAASAVAPDSAAAGAVGAAGAAGTAAASNGTAAATTDTTAAAEDKTVSPNPLKSSNNITPYFEFSAETWSTFAHNKDRVNLTEDELQKCLAFNDKISLEEVYNIYLPLSRLLFLYVRSRHDRSTVIKQFLGQSIESAPFIISISGSVACGKTTTANLLKHLISSWDTEPKVDLITTDGFLYPNKILHERHIEAKKGFPISYDVKALMTFLHKLKNGEPNLKVPVYSHLYYDVVPGEYTIVDRPDILILEGVNVLQNGADYPTIRNKVFISDFIDFSIYVDAEEDCLIDWYLERFLKLRESTFNNPNSYFHRYAKLPLEDAVNIATTIWSAVNHDNLIENILPSRNRANLIMHKGRNHCVERIYLRK